ncbi:MAG TPA: DUF1707 domain-containing protein [Streptosporangiaceae bacterium]|nr:DUF1707 domain-containing protein [Streptosporangiaceae bacterium]
MDPQGFNANSRLRASDADRDAAAAVINNALAEGRLTAEEHSGRLDAIYSAKTQGELVPLLDDLPGQRTAMTPSVSADLTRSRRHGRIVAIFAGATRKGPWHAEPVIEVLTVFGGVEIDFRDAILPGKEVILKATTVMGGVEVIVPPEMRVVDNGIAILGGREVTGNPPAASSPDAPVLRVEGACVLGGVEIKRKERKRKGSKKDSDAFGRSTLPYRRDVLDDVRGRRREIHDQIRDRRREIHQDMRERRREIRRTWNGDGDE